MSIFSILPLSTSAESESLQEQSSLVVTISPQQFVQKLGRGLDVDWSKTGKGMDSYSTKMVADFKNAGLSHVRIRVANDATDAMLSGLDKQISDCLKAGLIPIVAYQADVFKKNPNEANLNAAVAWWKKVAERYQNLSPALAFDLIIEVTDALNHKPDRLNAYHEKVVSTIRASNPHRILIISPRLRSDPDYLKDLKIPSQHNQFLMAEWHFYAAGPSKTNAKKRWTTGSAKEKALIQRKIQTALAWQNKTGIPTWVGAWMPGNYNDGDDYSVQEQVSFAKFVTCELDKAKVPFAVNSDTKFYDAIEQQWIIEMKSVLMAFIKPSNC